MASRNPTERERHEIQQRRGHQAEDRLARDKRDRDNERNRRRAGSWDDLPNRNTRVVPPR